MITPILNIGSLSIGIAAWGFGFLALKQRRISLMSFACCLLALCSSLRS